MLFVLHRVLDEYTDKEVRQKWGRNRRADVPVLNLENGIISCHHYIFSALSCLAITWSFYDAFDLLEQWNYNTA